MTSVDPCLFPDAGNDLRRDGECRADLDMGTRRPPGLCSCSGVCGGGGADLLPGGGTSWLSSKGVAMLVGMLVTMLELCPLLGVVAKLPGGGEAALIFVGLPIVARCISVGKRLWSSPPVERFGDLLCKRDILPFAYTFERQPCAGTAGPAVTLPNASGFDCGR